MATAKNHLTMEFSTTLTINETEIRALDALVGYGAEAFLKAFKERLGEAYISPHEEGIRSLFSAIARDVLPRLEEIKTIQADLLRAEKQRAARPTTQPGGHDGE